MAAVLGLMCMSISGKLRCAVVGRSELEGQGRYTRQHRSLLGRSNREGLQLSLFGQKIDYLNPQSRITPSMR